ncbi:MAG: hypothetical protein Q7S22_03825 [Candidatus Micrarchaeota archaeon]|nr:hypothetical protein [Candidatus Micrarchaeota archaeon]
MQFTKLRLSERVSEVLTKRRSLGSFTSAVLLGGLIVTAIKLPYVHSILIETAKPKEVNYQTSLAQTTLLREDHNSALIEFSVDRQTTILGLRVVKIDSNGIVIARVSDTEKETYLRHNFGEKKTYYFEGSWKYKDPGEPLIFKVNVERGPENGTAIVTTTMLKPPDQA